jgi:hypothetical protein
VTAVLLPLYHIILAGLKASPEQKKPPVLNPASVAKPSNTSITDTIESVVSAAREDDASKDSGSSVSKSGMAGWIQDMTRHLYNFLLLYMKSVVTCQREVDGNGSGFSE